MSNPTITAYYEDRVDFLLKDARLLLRDSFDGSCKTSNLSSLSKPDDCKSEKVLSQAKRSYTNKINQLPKASKKMVVKVNYVTLSPLFGNKQKSTSGLHCKLM